MTDPKATPDAPAPDLKRLAYIAETRKVYENWQAMPNEWDWMGPKNATRANLTEMALQCLPDLFALAALRAERDEARPVAPASYCDGYEAGIRDAADVLDGIKGSTGIREAQRLILERLPPSDAHPPATSPGAAVQDGSALRDAFMAGWWGADSTAWGSERAWDEYAASVGSRHQTECTDSEHASDCAVHNEPAMPNGPCDCAPNIRFLRMQIVIKAMERYRAAGGFSDKSFHTACEELDDACARLSSQASDYPAPLPASPGAAGDAVHLDPATRDQRGAFQLPAPAAAEVDRVRALEAALSVSAARFSQLADVLEDEGAIDAAGKARRYQGEISAVLAEVAALRSEP